MNEFEFNNTMHASNLFYKAWHHYNRNFIKILFIVLIVVVPVEGRQYETPNQLITLDE